MAYFITFEGIEGCGKSTQAKILSRALPAETGSQVVATREPGGCPIADKIRAILLDADNNALVPLAELLLYAAARAQHVAEVIRPALAEGKIVLCDRFTDATAAYQGHGRSLDLALIENLAQLATGGLTPDLTILLDCPEEVGIKRAMARINATSGAREERFEQESLRFHRAVREGYLKLAADNPARFVVIDGTLGIQETAEAIHNAVVPRILQG
ncbi:MAG: dTMP kinase [Deltaproteobacteria bacterium]|nr:dTMP kinase [Deltaproteobacteria bacterium]TLN05186.1 MAG: dTMP kinase [bacterium]